LIHEPMTLVTDLLLSGWALLLGLRLLSSSTSWPRWGWGLGLMATAAAALLGGVWHGFSPGWGDVTSDLIWRCVLLLIGVADVLICFGVISQSVHGRWQRRLFFLAGFKGGVFLLLLAWSDGFWVAVVDYLPTLFLILVLQVRRLRSEVSSRWLTGGALVALAAAGVQASDVSLLILNHNDLYHLVQGGALYGFYRGALDA